VAHEGGLARAQRAVQFDASLMQRNVARQLLREFGAGGFIGPADVPAS
jgi:hypothetical protein